MKELSVEPGLLPVFRLFAGIRFGLVLLGAVSRLAIRGDYTDPPSYILLWFSFADAALLMAYLTVPGLQRRLGRAFLPIGLMIASVGPIITQNLVLREWIDYGSGISIAGTWQLFPLLFIPLVLIGWQYNFRSIVLFSLGTAMLDWGLTMLAVNPPDLRLFALAGTLFVRTVSFLLVGYMVVRLMNTQREQRQALAEANTQLAHYSATLEQLATSRERNRLARELHDTLAHSLSGVAIQLEAVKTLWEFNQDQARSMLEQSLMATRNGLTETRRALQALRASPLEDLGLSLAIRNLAGSVAARYGLGLDLQVPERLDNLSPDMEQGIYRVIQEALQNITRHAQARNLKLRLSQVNGITELFISDDGYGFDLDKVDGMDQFGLKGMLERAKLMGGNLEINSQPGEGTIIRMSIGRRT